MLQTISIIVKGKVQGVYFRQSTKNKAIQLGIDGIVKNLPNGSVSIIATASAEQITQLHRWCNTGPPKANVTEVSVKNLPLTLYQSFSIEH